MAKRLIERRRYVYTIQGMTEQAGPNPQYLANSPREAADVYDRDALDRGAAFVTQYDHRSACVTFYSEFQVGRLPARSVLGQHRYIVVGR